MRTMVAGVTFSDFRKFISKSRWEISCDFTGDKNGLKTSRSELGPFFTMSVIGKAKLLFCQSCFVYYLVAHVDHVETCSKWACNKSSLKLKSFILERCLKASCVSNDPYYGRQ